MKDEKTIEPKPKTESKPKPKSKRKRTNHYIMSCTSIEELEIIIANINKAGDTIIAAYSLGPTHILVVKR